MQGSGSLDYPLRIADVSKTIRHNAKLELTENSGAMRDEPTRGGAGGGLQVQSMVQLMRNELKTQRTDYMAT